MAVASLDFLPEGSRKFYPRNVLLNLRKRKCPCISRSIRRRLFYFHILVRHIPVLTSSSLRLPASSAGRVTPQQRQPSPRFLTPLPRAPRHKPQHLRTLSLGLLNVRSLHNKIDDIIDLHRSLPLDIFCLVETWHDADSVCVQRLRRDGFTVIEQARPRLRSDTVLTNHGGVAIASTSPVLQSQVCLDFSPTTFEVVCSKFSCLSESFFIILIYRTGHVSSLFFDELSRVLDVMATFSKPLFLTGDLNIHVERPDDNHARMLLNTLSSYGLHCCVDFPTHESGGTLDVIFSRSDLLPINVNVCDPELSDHRLLTWSVPISKPPPVYRTVRFRPWKLLVKSHFRSLLIDSAICQPEAWQNIDCHKLAALFDETITSILDDLIPFRSLKLRHRTSDPWFDNDCRLAKRRVRRCERIFRRLHRVLQATDPCELISARLSWIESYRSYRQLLRDKRRDFWSARVTSQHNSPRDLWRSVDSIMGRGRSPAPTSITADDLQTFFVDKIAHVKAATAGNPSPSFSSAPADLVLSSFDKISEDSVLSILRGLPNKSSAFDALPVSLLKDCSDILVPFLTHIFNFSLSSGTFPNSWKQILLRPILKKGKSDPLDVKSYRPISNLCTLSKILEKLVSSQIKDFLCSNDLFPYLQSAYRSYHSTETAILKLTMDIFRSQDKGNVCLLSFLDLSSAFDSVNHLTLLRRLQISFGFCDSVLAWFSSFLTNRTQSVAFNDSTSYPTVLDFGVPQGSVLGPLLFVLYTSDLIPLVHSHDMHIHMYADDIQIYGFCPPSETRALSSHMSCCLDAVILWCASNSLNINVEKTEQMWCSSKYMKRSFSFDASTICSNSVSLVPKTHVKCLGVLIDNDLSFTSHVSKVVSSCFSTLRKIRSVRRSLPRPLLITLVNALVFPLIDYCVAALFGITKLQIRRLQRVLHASARLIFGSDSYSSVTPLLRSLSWLPVEARISYRLAVLAHSCLHGRAPAYLSNELMSVSSLSSRARLRSSKSSSLCVPAVRRPTIGGRSFQYTASTVWNSLPASLLTVHDTSCFKRLLKAYFLKQFYDL